MSAINIVIESEISRSDRCRQLEAMFDVPPQEKQRLEWAGELPIDDKEWNVGLIVGPSGSGKTTIGKELFGKSYNPPLKWKGKAVIDDFSKDKSIDDVSKVCAAVGFNTIPAWFRPYAVLSTGEKFRVEMARRLLEIPDPIVVDEFTSVVDRQVAQIGAHAVQKYIRRNGKKFVALSCHYDIIDWLDPDWIFEPATMKYVARGLLWRRPEVKCEIKRVGYEAWRIFAPFHYLTAELHKAARCFVVFVGDRPTAFAGVLKKPNWRKKGRDIQGISRVVTLPDWQGLGLTPALATYLGAAYRALGWRLRAYPAHPALIRVADKSPLWKLIKKPGLVQKAGKSQAGKRAFRSMRTVSRPGAVFEYCGPAMEREPAEKLINGPIA